MDKILLTVKEMCEYTGWGESKVRQLLRNPNSTFSVRMGNRLYANKKLFDEYIDKCSKYNIKI